jgi:hypothetical protein
MSDSEIRGYCFTPDEVITDHQGQSRGAALAGKSWDRGKTLRILFLDGPSECHDRVATHVKTWEDSADIKFVCSTDPSSEIRVTFTRAIGRFYSMIGTDALLGGFPPDNHTMNLGILPDWTLGAQAVEREIRRLILHEFGHSLGLIHEHSSPTAGSIFKDPELVYAYYQRTQGWDRAMVDQNVLTVYSRSQISNLTQFDPDSIMLYQFPPEITSRPTKINYELSSLDKVLIGALYPMLQRPEVKTPAPTISPGGHAAQAVGRALSFDTLLNVMHGVPGTRDVYHFEVDETATFLIETTGENGWGLTLFKSESTEEAIHIQTDEGSGPGLNCRITRELEPGIYYVAINHVLADGTGAYGVIVRKLGT